MALDTILRESLGTPAVLAMGVALADIEGVALSYQSARKTSRVGRLRKPTETVFSYYDLSLPENRATFIPKEWTSLVVVYMDDRGPKPITCTKSVQVPKADGKGTKAKRVPDIWDNDYAEAWIRDRYAYIQQVIAEEGIPPIPDNFVGWEHPLCGFCPKKKECIELEYTGVIPTPVTLTTKSAPRG